MSVRHPGGFTLIEIAIVLVVMALILSGVLLASNAVIERSRMASLIAKINDIAGASRTFKSKYGYFPGDLPNAGTYITENGGVTAGCSYPPAVTPGPGDGLVNTATESDCALEHMVKAGLLSKIDLDGFGKYFVSSNFDVGRVSLWFIPATNENAVRVTSVPCDIALEIDRKKDSAATTPMNSGTVRGLDADNAPIATTCIPGDPAQYDPVPTLLIKY